MINQIKIFVFFKTINEKFNPMKIEGISGTNRLLPAEPDFPWIFKNGQEMFSGAGWGNIGDRF